MFGFVVLWFCSEVCFLVHFVYKWPLSWLENLDMSEILAPVRILLEVQKCQEKNFCRGKTAKNCQLLVAYMRRPSLDRYAKPKYAENAWSRENHNVKWNVTFVRHLHYQRSKTCSKHVCVLVPTSLTDCFVEYEQWTLCGALVVTRAMLLRLINCRFIITYYYINVARLN